MFSDVNLHPYTADAAILARGRVVSEDDLLRIDSSASLSSEVEYPAGDPGAGAAAAAEVVGAPPLGSGGKAVQVDIMLTLC